MAIRLIANYSKRLGLPGYSSHQFSVSVETELMQVDDVAGEAERLYQLLQANVDEQIIQTGFVPPSTYGMDETGADGSSSANDHWKCSDKQRDLILKLVDEHELDRHQVDQLAHERFGKGVKALGKLEASGLIDELLDNHGGRSPNGSRRGQGRNAYAGSRNGGGR